MTANPAYKKVIQKIEAYRHTWEALLDLPGIEVTHRFHETFQDPENADTTLAQTVCQWQYREAVIHWYLPNAARQADVDLERAVIHEYVHILNAPIKELCNDEMERLELATENVARALFSTYRKGL